MVSIRSSHRCRAIADMIIPEVTMDAFRAMERLRGGLVVSCQAPEGNPMRGPSFMAAMARAAVLGGACGIRAEGVEDIRAIRAAVGSEVPIIGILKTAMPDGSLFITGSIDHAHAVRDAGAELVALDGTRRPRPGGDTLSEVIAAIQASGGLALADIDTADSAQYAIECGADAVGTTMSGYTPQSVKIEGPDFALLETLTRSLDKPVFAEGRLWTREDAARAIDLGASFVVVGTAITNPMAITARFVAAMHRP